MAPRPSKLFGDSPEFWLKRQRDMDLWNAARALQREFARIHPSRSCDGGRCRWPPWDSLMQAGVIDGWLGHSRRCFCWASAGDSDFTRRVICCGADRPSPQAIPENLQ